MLRATACLFALLLGAPAQAESLAEALAQAWARQPQAQAMSAREAAAEAGTALAAGMTPAPPSLSLASRNDRLDRNRGKQEWEIELAVPLWLPGQQTARAGEAESGVAEVAARRSALRLQIAGELREAWWALAAARQVRDLAARREASAGALEAAVLRRYKAGELARVDANLAQNERLAAASELLEATNALRQAEQNYRGLTGADAPAVLAGEDPAPLRDSADSHPQLAAAAAAASVARARLKVAAETPREPPELALRLVRERGEFGEAYASTLGVKLTVPFSSGARVRQENSAARAEAVQAEAELALLRQRIALDTARLRMELALAEEQLAKARERQELTADSLRLAEKSFALGESDLPSVLRARGSAFEAEAFLLRQRTARAASVSRLNQSLGVLP